MVRYCYLNGRIISINKAGMPLNDIGLLRGYGVFEFLRTYNGQPFLLKEHLDRLENSAKELNLKIPLSQKQIAAQIKKLLIKNKLKEANIRIILTGGRTADGISFDPNSPTFYILVEKLHELPKSLYHRGIKLITYEHQREVSGAKTINYLTAIKLQPISKRAGAFEILYTWQGQVLEATTSNFFIFKEEALITPKDNVLVGTTRNLVISLAKRRFKVEERLISVQELEQASEAFITATNKEILPVVKINDQKIGNGKVGKNTKYLTTLFQEHTKF